MRGRCIQGLVARWVLGLMLAACNGPISDWPSSGSNDEGPQGGAPSDGGVSNPPPGVSDAGAGDDEDALDASAAQDAAAGSAPDAGSSGALDAGTCVGHDAGAALPDAGASDGAVDAQLADAGDGGDAQPGDAMPLAQPGDSGADAWPPLCP